MNTFTSTSTHPARPAWRQRIGQAGTRLWNGLQERGRAQAQRHLRDIAFQCEAGQPELARRLRATVI